jgi:hypothetical protein
VGVSDRASRGRKYVPSYQPSARTITQRSSITARNVRQQTTVNFSSDRTSRVRPHSRLSRLHGMRNRHSPPSIAPAALARSELTTSPRMSRAKLVVMPHAGQGIFVML